MKYLLHIGANKTGTSSIQTMLAANAPALAKAGWVYPDFHRRHAAHHDLALAIKGHPGAGLPEGWRGRLARLTAAPDRRFVFSSEVLFRLVPPAKVARFFPPGQTRVVLYLRDHLGYMLSWYAQAVQGRNVTCSFEDYVQIFHQPLAQYLAGWEEVYGRDSLVLRSFSRAALAGGDVRRDFIGLIEGCDAADFDLSAAESNPSISGNLLFFKKALNAYMTAAEARTDPIPDEFGRLAALKDSFRGRFAATKAEVDLVRRTFAADRTALMRRGLRFEPMPEAVAGHASPDPDTLTEDMRLIKHVALETQMTFLTHAARWQDWHSL